MAPTSAKRSCGLSPRLGSVLLGLVLTALTIPAAAGADPTGSPVRVYSHRLEPREHPDYHRRAVKPPDWDTFEGRTQFTTLRGFNVQDDVITGYAEELERFTRTHELGRVIWPSYPILFARNLGEFADEMRRRNLYLFDIWGYVPGSGPGGYWQQFKPPAEAFRLLESKLGDRWLGTDIGEQDGRYIGGYANQMTPASGNRLEQYLQFQRHFERMGDDLGHRHATLVSLNFGHYFLKEGTYTLIGAETAQALPNNQVYYAFIRGAGKQYGVPWFGNASVFNRWGFKNYAPPGKSDGYEFGPTKGTSLSLLKRLLYSHILGDAVAVGFENMWFDGDKLSPVGRIQQSAQRWVTQYGSPGVMHTPVGLLLDFESGWSFPRHLYSDKIFRVWGNLPYERGDQLTDAILDLLYPGYADSSFFHDETGFISPTPFGDIADALLSDAPLWLLRRYPVLIVASAIGRDYELQDKLDAYVEGGGELVITAENLERMPDGIGGRRKAGAEKVIPIGRGRLRVLGNPFGVVPAAGRALPKSEIDKPLPRPYRLDADVRQGLTEVLSRQQLFEVRGDGLSVITCRRGPGSYVVGIANNTWQPQDFEIRSRCGSITTQTEWPIDTAERTAIGFTPEGIDAAITGTNGPRTIAGGDIRVFAIQVQETGVEEIPHLAPPPRPQGRYLTLRRIPSLKEAILSRPTFFEHHDGVCIEGRYLREHERQALSAESGWLKRQGLRIAVDLSSELNLYPGLRLLNNSTNDYAASQAALEDVLNKMEILGARDLLLSLHRHPENNFSEAQSQAGFESTLKELAKKAADRGITVHLRLAYGKPPWGLEEGLRWLDRVGAANLKLAPSTALLAAHRPPNDVAAKLKGRLGFWMVAASKTDLAGALWDAHAPVHNSGQEEVLTQWLRLAPEVPLIADAVLVGANSEYLEARAIEDVVAGREPSERPWRPGGVTR